MAESMEKIIRFIRPKAACLAVICALFALFIIYIEQIITFFTPAYHSISTSLFGQDMTLFLAGKWGVPWWRVHEYLLAVFITTTLIFGITTIVLSIKLRRR